jgi:hypothetical protein
VFLVVIGSSNHEKNSLANNLNSSAWLEFELNRSGVQNIKQADGVHLCNINSSVAIAVILVDQCKDPVFLQAGFLTALPHILIAEHPVYSNSLKSPVMHISELQSGSRIIAKEIAKCIRSFKKTKCKNPLACVIPAVSVHGDKLVLSRSKETIYINGVEIANINARLKFHVLNPNSARSYSA